MRFTEPGWVALRGWLPEGAVIGLEGETEALWARLGVDAEAVWVGGGPPGALSVMAPEPVPVLEALAGAGVRWARLSDPLALSEAALRSIRPVAGMRLVCDGWDQPAEGPLQTAQILLLRRFTHRVRVQGATPEGGLCLRIWRGACWERVVV
jgi:hypothetical protein